MNLRHGPNSPNGPLSPASFNSNTNSNATSDWSPLTRYGTNGNDQPFSGPYPDPRGPPRAGPPSRLITPPTSGHTSADTTHTDGPMSRPGGRRPSNGNPSPPSSVARSSVGTTMMSSRLSSGSQMDPQRRHAMEEALSDHYIRLKRWLAPYLRGQQGPPSNKARDKLVRLTPVQFQELSTDVFDELLRREDERAAGGPGAPGNNIPNHLLPKNNFHFKRNQARQKLSTLPTDRFRQLATDVFYELERRFPHFAGGPRPASPAGSMMSGYGGRPPPNRANGYGGPPPPQFRAPPRNASLASNPPEPFANKPQPKTFQSNTIVPDKGTMVEDDEDDVDGMANGQGAVRSNPEQEAQIRDLEDKVDELNKQLRDKDDEHEGKMSSLRMQLQETEQELESSREQGASAGNQQAEWQRLRSELENKLARAEDFQGRLQSELDSIRRDRDATERDLRQEVESAREHARQMPQQDDSLQRKYEALQDELAEQQHITDEVRREALGYLSEMRAMSDNSHGSLQREEQLAEQVSLMERELRDWKARYARSKTQMRSLRPSSAGLGMSPPDLAGEARNNALMDSRGLVRDIDLTKFQLSIDELLQSARRPDHTHIIEAMKGMVTNVRSITANLPSADSKENGANGQVDPARKMKMRVSATANNLITACKNHASSAGLSPVSLVDAAASHLSMAVIELVKLVKVRPTSPEELTEEEAALSPLSAGGTASRSKYGALTGGLRTHSSHLSKSSIGSANFSITSSPRRTDYLSSRTSDDSPSYISPNGHNKPSPPLGLGLSNAIREVEPGLEAYKNYLEDQTALLVQNIQPLVNTIRSGRNAAQVDGYVNEISKAISDISSKTQGTIASTGNRALAKHTPPVIDVLEDCRRALVTARAQGDREKMPPVAFRIARATKELVLRVDRVKGGELTADMNYPLEM